MGSRVMTAVRAITPFVIGASVWGSSLLFMTYGLWTGAWYGYVFAAIFAIYGAFLARFIYGTKAVMDAAFIQREMEIEREDDR